jgi:protein-glutamine gamma-glutamyltransferase
LHLLRSFRLSTYLTLAMACLCLGYSEGDLLPEGPYITAAVILSLGIAYRLEGRWSLSLRAANFVGGALILLLVAWIAFQFVRDTTALLQFLPFPAFILPYLGPVIMILIPAKLFRPKHNGDYWTMQGIGLLAVALGCAMANDMFFGVLLIGYLFFFAWSMALFYLYREASELDRIPMKRERRWRTYLFRVSWRWSGAISAVALLLFVLTPRPNDSKWELPMVMRGRMETGLTDSNVDLNRTGILEQNDELAFTVEAKDASGVAKLDLDRNQRWRASALVVYESGKWMRGREVDRMAGGPFSKGSEGKRPEGIRLPDFGPRSYTLTYTLARPTAATTIAATPILWRPNDRPPIHVFGSRGSPVIQRPDRFFEWAPSLSPDRPAYVQMTAMTREPDLGPPMLLSTAYLEFLTRMPSGAFSDRLRRHTSNLLVQLVQKGTLTPQAIQDLDPLTGLPSVRQHEAIARALESHLSSSDEFRYTMELERTDRNLDPVEDFLFHSKAGHCQRFASALALMLRSQGIPAQFVLGYRGCEALDDGHYEVRQYHAHAWVEAVIRRSPPTQVVPPLPDAAPLDLPTSHHWLSLDPTPGGSPEKNEVDTFSEWLEDTLARGENFFKNFILRYNSEAREKALNSIGDRLDAFGDDIAAGKITWPVAIVGASVLFVPVALLVRRRLRRRRFDAAERSIRQELAILAPFHRKLLALLARHGWTPRTGQTAREFAAQVAAELSRSERTALVAEVPLQIAEAYYRVRFGNQAIAPTELQEFAAGLQRLSAALDGRALG